MRNKNRRWNFEMMKRKWVFCGRLERWEKRVLMKFEIMKKRVGRGLRRMWGRFRKITKGLRKKNKRWDLVMGESGEGFEKIVEEI